MNESQWLSSADPQAMLVDLTTVDRDRLYHRNSDRKLRLFAVGCCRQVWPLLTDERSRRAVETAERFADGEATIKELYNGLRVSYEVQAIAATPVRCMPPICCFDNSGNVVAGNMITTADRAGVSLATQAVLLRCLFNPFRPVTFGWKTVRAAAHMSAGALESGASEEQVWFGDWMPTPTVIALAQTIYQDRSWELMHALRDALEESGCCEETVLAHCLEPTHARGCWCLDAILGKS